MFIQKIQNFITSIIGLEPFNLKKSELCKGYKHSLQEVLLKDEVAQRLSDTKAAKEVKSLERFQNLLMDDPDRAFYGRSQVILKIVRCIFTEMRYKCHVRHT